MSYLACTYNVALGLLVSMTDVMEMLRLTLIDSYLDNMRSDYKSNNIILLSRNILLDIFGSSRSQANTSGLDYSDAELWHFTCTSKSGYIIRLSGISKGHNLYLFIWCLRCQCFCVQHEFFQGRCQRSGPC